MCCFLLLPLGMRAQEETDFFFSADRPGMGTGTDVLPLGTLQWETGAAYDRGKHAGACVHTYTLNNSLLRYGLTRQAELCVEWNAVCERQQHETKWGIAPIAVGTKVKVHESDNGWPTVSLLAQLALPVGTKAFRPDHVAPALHALFGHTLSDRLDLGYEVGLDWDGETADATTFTALGLTWALDDRWAVFAENFNYFPCHAHAQWNADFGLTWMAGKRIQLDASGSFRIDNPASWYNIGVGVAWLIR